MTAAIRELLRKAIDQGGRSMSIALQDEIDAALAEKAPEPLTDEQIDEIFDRYVASSPASFNLRKAARAIERALGATPPASPDDARDAIRREAFMEVDDFVRGYLHEESQGPHTTALQFINAFREELYRMAAIEREGGANG